MSTDPLAVARLCADYNTRIAELEAELAAERKRREAWQARAEAAERELHNIARAAPSEWDESLRDQFQQWAQSRARDYLDAAIKD